VKAAAMSHVFSGQQQLDLFHALAEPRHRLIRRAAEAAEFVRQKSPREPDIEAPAADRVQHTNLAGELERVIEYRRDRAGHQTSATRALRGRGEKEHWVRAIAAIVMEIMLDDANVGEPEFFRLLCEEERFVEIFAARFLLGLDVGKKLHAKFHFGLRALPGRRRFSGRSDWRSSLGRGSLTLTR
jgi:hypothetical protein